MHKYSWLGFFTLAGLAFGANSAPGSYDAGTIDNLQCPGGNPQDTAAVLQLLPPVLEKVHSPWGAARFTLTARTSGADTQHLLFNLAQDGIPVEGEALMLTTDNECRLIDYQYHVSPTLPPLSPDTGKTIGSDQEALGALQRLYSEGSSERTLLLRSLTIFKLSDRAGNPLPSTIYPERAEVLPLYRVQNDKLVLGYHTMMPITAPNGVIEHWWSSEEAAPQRIYQRFPLRRQSINQSPPVSLTLSPQTWLDYGQHPARTLGTPLPPDFWTLAPQRQVSLVTDLGQPLETPWLRLSDTQNFTWPTIGDSLDGFRQRANADQLYRLGSMLTALAWGDRSLAYFGDRLGYAPLLQQRPTLLLQQDIRGDRYLAGLDTIELRPSALDSCPAVTFDPGALLHELGHALFARLQPTLSKELLAISINEGFSDFWAGNILRQDPSWNGHLTEFKDDICTSSNSIRDLKSGDHDYFDGLESKLVKIHQPVYGPYGPVQTEVMFAHPLLEALESLEQEQGEAGQTLANKIVLESISGLLPGTGYRPLAERILIMARHLDTTGRAEQHFRLALTNANLLPRQVEPVHREVMVMPIGNTGTLLLRNNSTDQIADEVTLALGNGTPVTSSLTPGEHHLPLPAQAPTCGEATESSLLLQQTEQGVSIQNKHYPVALIGGYEHYDTPLASAQDGSLNLIVTEPLLWHKGNQRQLIRLTTNGALAHAPSLEQAGLTYSLRQMAHVGNQYWLQGDEKLESGVWRLAIPNASAELVSITCLPPLTLDGPNNLNEKETLKMQARLGDIPVEVNWHVLEKSYIGNELNLTLPDLAVSTDILVNASMSWEDGSVTQVRRVSIKASNAPTQFRIEAPDRAEEESVITLKAMDVIDPDSAGYLEAEWSIDDQIIGSGMSVTWRAPANTEERTAILTLKLRDIRDENSTVSQSQPLHLLHRNRAPSLKINGATTLQAGEVLHLDAITSDLETANDNLLLSWQWQDESASYKGAHYEWVSQPAATTVQRILLVRVSDGDQVTEQRLPITVMATQAPMVTLDGPSQSVGGESVILTAHGSDPSQRPLTYRWLVLGQVPNQQISANQIQLILPRDNGGQVQVQVTVDNGVVHGSTHSLLTWSAYPNKAPAIQVSGPTQARPGERVQLTAEASDPDQWPSALNVTWRQVSGPGISLDASGNRVSLLIPNNAAGQRLEFEADAFDGSQHTATRWAMNVSDQPRHELIVAPIPGEVGEATMLLLDAHASHSASNQALTYRWELLDGGAPISGLPASGERVRLQLPEVSGDIPTQIRLIASDGTSEQSQVIEFIVLDKGPTAIDYTPPTAQSQEQVTLEAGQLAALHMERNKQYRFAWRQTSGSKAELGQTDQESLTITLPRLTNDEALGFAVTITTPDKGERTYTTQLQVKGRVEASPPQSAPVSGGGGGGALSWGWLLLLAGAIRCRRTE